MAKFKVVLVQAPAWTKEGMGDPNSEVPMWPKNPEPEQPQPDQLAWVINAPAAMQTYDQAGMVVSWTGGSGECDLEVVTSEEEDVIVRQDNHQGGIWTVDIRALDPGTYKVWVTDIYTGEEIVSDEFEVGGPVYIQEQPQGIIITAGQDLKLDVVAYGGPGLKYKWQNKGSMDAGLNFANISTSAIWLGTDTPELTRVAAATSQKAAGIFRCALTDINGVQTFTDEVYAGLDGLVLTTDLTDSSTQVYWGDTNFLCLIIALSGKDVLTYQWQKDGVDIVDGVTASGMTNKGSKTRQFSIDGFRPDGAGKYTCKVTDKKGNTVTSKGKTATYAAPLFTTQPAATYSRASPTPIAPAWNNFKSGSVEVTVLDSTGTLVPGSTTTFNKTVNIAANTIPVGTGYKVQVKHLGNGQSIQSTAFDITA